MDSIQLIYILSAILLVYYVIKELFSSDSDNSSKWILLLMILAFAAYLAWNYYQNRQAEEIDELPDLSEENSNPYYKESKESRESRGNRDSREKGGEESIINDQSIQTEYEEKNVDIKINDFAVENTNEITYTTFKKWYLNPDFIKKYTSAMKQSCVWYKRKLADARKKIKGNLLTMKSGNDTSPLGQILDRNDDTKIMETAMTQLLELYLEVQAKEKLINEEYCKKCLITALTDRKNGIDSLTGRTEIKDFLALRLYAFSQNPLTFLNSFQNIELHGVAGSGKTKVAEVIGFVYAKSGLLIRDHVHVITSQSVTTAYVNESGRLARRLLYANLGSVIFIDEAYSFGGEKTFGMKAINHGEEAITEIVNFIDKMQGLSLIIAAGYTEPMQERFHNLNEGIPRRFPFVEVLPPYSSEELTNITIIFLLKTCNHINFRKEHGNILFTYINYLYERNEEIFKNQAGSCANLAGAISRAIYGTPNKNWDTDAESLILNGVNSYLKSYNISLGHVDDSYLED